jgi:plasmid stabilization system protein ParE
LAYSVRFSPLAENDIEKYRLYILKQSHDDIPARNWVKSLLDDADRLRDFPHRCPRIPEQHHFKIVLHHLIHQSHRLIFHIDGNMVEILRVYPAAARPPRSLHQRPEPKKPS